MDAIRRAQGDCGLALGEGGWVAPIGWRESTIYDYGAFDALAHVLSRALTAALVRVTGEGNSKQVKLIKVVSSYWEVFEWQKPKSQSIF